MASQDLVFAQLNDEIQREFHARPALSIDPSKQLIYHWAGLSALADSGDALPTPTPIAAFVAEHFPFAGRHAQFELPGGALRIERHTEFFSFTYIPTKGAWLPDDTLQALQQDHVFSATCIELGGAVAAPGDSAVSERLYGGKNSSMGCDIQTTFKPDEQGFVHYKVGGAVTDPIIRGRIVKLLTDIELYRLAAMMSLPLVRRHSALLSQLEGAVQTISRGFDDQQQEPNEGHVHDISELLLSVHQLEDQTQYRFAASMAYADIVDARLQALNELPVGIRTTLRDFIDHRLSPAMKSVRAFDSRTKALGDTAHKLMSLARTKFDLEIQTQNKMLLELMADRAIQQIRLTHAVEGFSVVAITYYMINLINYVLDAAPPLVMAGFAVSDDLLLSVAIPMVALTTFTLIRLIQRRVGRL